MAEADLPLGKLPLALLREVLASAPLPPEVLLGPAPGEDACAIDLGGGTLVAATDPITMSGAASSTAGRHAVIINANDVAVTGVEPRWFLASVLLPPGTRASAVRALFASLREGLAEVGASLVGGHTEVTAAVNQAVVTGQMLGFSVTGRFVRTGGLRPGDSILQVGPAPVEGAALLAHSELPNGVDPAVIDAARQALDTPGISVVKPALIAAGLGATSLHDPTEGGLATGLWEMADASGVRIDVDPEQVQWFAPGLALCRALELDPWGTLASGALLIGVGPEDAAHLRAELSAAGHSVTVLASAVAGAGVRLGAHRLARFERDELSRLASVRRN